MIFSSSDLLILNFENKKDRLTRRGKTVIGYNIQFPAKAGGRHEAAHGALPLVRSGATQTALTFASQGRRLAERAIHGRRSCIEMRFLFQRDLTGIAVADPFDGSPGSFVLPIADKGIETNEIKDEPEENVLD